MAGVEMKTSNVELGGPISETSQRMRFLPVVETVFASIAATLILSRRLCHKQPLREQASDSLPERETVRGRDVDRQFFVRMVVNLLNLPNLRDQQPDVHGDSPNVGLLSSRKVGSSGFERAFARRHGLIRFR
jgi:hypothetical protein